MNKIDSRTAAGRACGAGNPDPNAAGGGNGISRAERDDRKIEKLREEVAYHKARFRITQDRIAELSAELEELKKEKSRASVEHGRSEEGSAGEEVTAATRADPAAGPLPPVSDESIEDEEVQDEEVEEESEGPLMP